MELKDLILLYKKRGWLFFGIIAAFLLLGFGIFRSQADFVRAEMLLNVSRDQIQVTQEYAFDDFYRLQADERFADTVVTWLSSKPVLDDITKASSQLNPIESLKARRLSSQAIKVTYTAQTRGQAERVAKAILVVLNRMSGDLNERQKDPSWFVVLGSDPVVEPGPYPLGLVMVVALGVGLFVAFWSVLIVHYWKEE